MTRRWLSLIAVLGCVLALTPSASAECAWVLWNVALLSTRDSFEPVEAYTSKAECEDAKERFDARAKAQGLQIVTEKTVKGMFYRCLPETVDPRAPMGK